MHRWRKEGVRWIINCDKVNKEFDPIFWKRNNKELGLCPYCGEDYEKELEERRRNREIEFNKDFKEKMEKERNTLKAYIGGDE